ncbi:MAG TPA: GNAT family N-acyltransferase, partial [Alphaproteobacteria bacterium]|nr:GNAT family N-acyltransferase [Alphaproteobacteria bacterium]
MHQLSTANQPGGPTPIRVRNLEIKMAGSTAEIDAAQALRYQVFYQEMSAKPSANMKQQQRDFDRF